MTRFMTRTTWTWADATAAATSTLCILLYMFGGSLGRIEGALFPVAKGFEVTQVLATGENETRIWGEFLLERPGCTFHQIEWFLVGEAREVLITVAFEEGPKVRSSGKQGFGPWLLQVPQALLSETRADVIHQCLGRPWRTVTRIYP